MEHPTRHLVPNIRLILATYNLAQNQVIGSTLLFESDCYQLYDRP